MKRVLVTGVNGFLGRHTARELETRGWEVTGVARSRALSADIAVDLSNPLFLDTLRRVEQTRSVAAAQTDIRTSHS